MSVIFKGVKHLYYYLNEDIADPRTQNWFLIRTPWPGLALLALHLTAVLHWLPRYMRTRQAYDLRYLIALYNLIQIVGCSYVIYNSLTLGWLNHYSVFCHPPDDTDDIDYAWKVCYGYFVLKVLDLLDTLPCGMTIRLLQIFFSLRKKHKQISFLHVYHHTGMVAVSWGLVKWMPGGHYTLLLVINSFVHVIMYSYYLLTIWSKDDRRSLWWKKHVTQLQIFQFMLIFLHFSSLMFIGDCKVPLQPAYILLPQIFFIILLFSDFYRRTYVKGSKKQI